MLRAALLLLVVASTAQPVAAQLGPGKPRRPSAAPVLEVPVEAVPTTPIEVAPGQPLITPPWEARARAARERDRSAAAEKAALKAAKAKPILVPQKIPSSQPTSAAALRHLPFERGSETGRYVRAVALPTAVIDYVREQYPYQVIAEAIELTDAAGGRAWEVAVAGQGMRFDATGSFLRKVAPPVGP